MALFDGVDQIPHGWYVGLGLLFDKGETAMTKKQMILALTLIFIPCWTKPLTAQSKPIQPEYRSKFSIDVSFDVGTSITSYKPVLQKDWQRMFVPAKNGMKPSVTTHPLASGFKLGMTRTLSGDNGSWQIKLPISYQLLGLNFNRIHPKFYLFKNGVAGTTLNWWDTVMVNDIVAEHFTPRVGIEFAKKDRSIVLSAQHYRLVARNYVGKDCVNCQNSSKVVSTQQLESGISPRLDIFLRRTKLEQYSPLSGLRYGIFVEAVGPKTIRFGLTGRWNKAR